MQTLPNQMPLEPAEVISLLSFSVEFAGCLVYRVYTILTFKLGFEGKSGPIVKP